MAATAPTAPTASVSALPSSTPTGSLFTVGAGKDFTTLHAALTHVSTLNPNLNHVFELTAGETFTGEHAAPLKSGTGWVTIRSSRWAELPLGRVGPAHAALMPKIMAAGDFGLAGAALTLRDESHGWRVLGCEITISPTAPTNPQAYYIVTCGLGSGPFGWKGGSFRAWSMPEPRIGSRYSIEKCWIHGASTTANITTGIYLASADTRVQDCYFENIQDTVSPDGAKALNCIDGPGPYLIHNNFISCAGPSFMAGGAPPSVTNLTPSDITFTQNIVTKDLRLNPSHATYQGAPERAAKNLFELKHAMRVLVKGNTFTNCWPSAGQGGTAILINCHDQDFGAAWTSIQDVNIESNVISTCSAGPVMFWRASGASYRRVRYANNLAINVGQDVGGPPQQVAGSSSFAVAINVPPLEDLWIEHNTCFQNRQLACHLATNAGSTQLTNFTVKNNISGLGAEGAAVRTENIPPFATYVQMTEADMAVRAPGAVLSKNMLCQFGTYGRDQAGNPVYPSGAGYPTGFAVRGSAAAVGVSLADGTLTPSSPFKAGNADAADDGTDNGVDFVALAAVLPSDAPDLIAPTLPGTPTLVSATATSATITWTASTDAGGVTGYNVARRLGMAIDEVGSGTQRAQIRGDNVTSATGIFPASVGSGRLLVVTGAFWHPNSGVSVGVTDTRSTSYTVRHGTEVAWVGGFRRIYLAWGLAPSSGACTVTVTASAAGAYLTGTVDEFSGVHATPLEVDTTQSTGTGTAASDGLTTLTDGALVVGIVNHAATTGIHDITAGTGYTLLDSDETGARAHYGAEFKIAGAAGAQTVAFTISSSQTWTVLTAAFAPAVAGVTAVVGTPTTNAFTDTGLTPATAYSYTVQAFDPADNTSAFSAGLLVTTLSGGGGPVSRVVTTRPPVATRAPVTTRAVITL